MSTPVRPVEGRQRGYSIVELLVVVALIGLITLVTVPNFIQLYKSGRMKGTVRNFATVVRTVQQQAVTKNQRMKICFKPPGNRYTLWQEVTDNTTGLASWQQIGDARELQTSSGSTSTTYFESTDFTDENSDSINDVIFNPNGTVFTPAAAPTPEIVIKTTDAIKKPTYTLTFSPTGSVTVS